MVFQRLYAEQHAIKNLALADYVLDRISEAVPIPRKGLLMLETIEDRLPYLAVLSRGDLDQCKDGVALISEKSPSLRLVMR